MSSNDVSIGDRIVIGALTNRRVAFAINKLFNLGVEPVPLSLERICETYDAMKETCRLYSERAASFSWLKKRDIRLSEMELLRIIEFESAHYVCRRSGERVDQSHLQDYFLEQLYARPEMYCFFQPRDEVIRAFSSFGWLKLEDFTRSHG